MLSVQSTEVRFHIGKRLDNQN